MSDSSILAVIGSLIAGILTAVVSVQLALRRFRRERWWERKAQAYSNLFTALFDIQRSLRHEIARTKEGKTYSAAYSKEVGERATAGYSEVRKAAVFGTFLFSRGTSHRLDGLVRQLDNPHHNSDFYEQLCDDLEAVTSTLDELKSLSRKDLALDDRLIRLPTQFPAIRRHGATRE